MRTLAALILSLGVVHPVEAASVAELRQDWESLLRAWDDGSDLVGFPFLDCFEGAAAEQRVPLPLLVGLAWGESSFEPTARSEKNAVGIMQILWPSTARDLGFESFEELEEPCANIRAGARYLRHLLDRVGDDTVLALASYNHGPGAIDGDDGNLNDHARWYVRYIYDKTAAVLARRSWSDGRGVLRLSRFTDYEMARVAMVRYRRLVRARENADPELTIQLDPAGRYELRVLCASPSGIDAERARYERITGFRPRELPE